MRSSDRRRRGQYAAGVRQGHHYDAQGTDARGLAGADGEPGLLRLVAPGRRPERLHSAVLLRLLRRHEGDGRRLRVVSAPSNSAGTDHGVNGHPRASAKDSVWMRCRRAGAGGPPTLGVATATARTVSWIYFTLRDFALGRRFDRFPPHFEG